MITRNNRTAGTRRVGLMAWFLALALLLVAQWPANAQTTSITLTNASLVDLQNALNQSQFGPVTIYLDFTNTITTTEPLYIGYDATIIATETNSVVISGGGNSEVFFVDVGVNFTLGNIIVSGGNDLGGVGAVGTTGGSGSHGNPGGTGTSGGGVTGGGIYNLGNILLTNCIFLTNTATGGAGGSGGGGGNGTGIGGNGGAGGNGGFAHGGAIYNGTNAVLVASNCTFTGNVALGGTAGVGGTNGAGGFAYPGNGGIGGTALGGAIYNDKNGMAIIWDCTFSDNFTQAGSSQAAGQLTSNGSGGTGPGGPTGAGGGIYNLGTNLIINSTFFLNLATGGDGGDGAASPSEFGGNGGNGGSGAGGSLCNAGTGVTRITNCTFAGGAAFGGTNGIAGSGAFAGNSGSPGGSYGASIANLAGTVYLKNSILAYPTNGANYYGAVSDGNNNLSSDTTPAFTQTNSFKSRDPKLQPLGFNGGPTETMALQARSPAITNVYDNSAPAFDQRGYQRPIGIRPCGGAFEYGLITYAISGQLTAGAQFIPGVLIHVGGASTNTDANGEFLLNLPAGNYTVSLQNPKLFQSGSTNITVPPGVANLNFRGLTNALAAITNVSGAVQLTFTGFSNLNYNIQASTNIAQSTNWLTLTNVKAGAGGVFTFTDSSPNHYTNRFYRAAVR